MVPWSMANDTFDAPESSIPHLDRKNIYTSLDENSSTIIISQIHSLASNNWGNSNEQESVEKPG